MGYELVDFASALPPEDIGLYVAELGASLRELYIKQSVSLAEISQLQDLFTNIEMPSVPILANIELAGIGLDINYLSIIRYLEDEISDIEQTIYGYAEQNSTYLAPNNWLIFCLMSWDCLRLVLKG